jgi:CBS domain containing-hemolysin-like protein
MDTQSIYLVLTICFLILLSAFFSSAETSFSALNRIRVKALAENGSKRAKLVLRLYDDFDRTLSTTLIGNNVVSLTAASLAAVLFIRYFGDHGALLSTLAITVAVLIFGDITPKSLAKEAPESFALFCAPVLFAFAFVLTPINALFALWKKMLRRIFKTSPWDRAITEEELLSIVEEAESEGAIDQEDRRLIRSAIEFNDLQARDILTPRMGIVGIPKDVRAEEMAALFLESGYSRLPVYEESIDNIVGVIHMRDCMEYMVNRNGTLGDIIAPAVFIAPAMKINELFKMLQKEKIHLAVVADEYGGTEGIVTMEDILEELVGEIWDERDEIVEEFVALGDNQYRIVCAADVDKMFEYFSLTGEADSNTVSGWIMDRLGKIPEEGDAFVYENLKISVNKIGQRKALECIITVE